MMFEPDEKMIKEHRNWLAAFHKQSARSWENLLKADPEAAMCEAGVRSLLEARGLLVEPNESMTGNEPRPDFKCRRDTYHFYVEVTHIPIDKASRVTGLEEGYNYKRNPTPLNRLFFWACKGKASQCGNQDAPVLLAVGTFHENAALLSLSPPWPNMLLTGNSTMTVSLDRKTLSPVGEALYETELESAVFLKPVADDQTGFARSSISGLLLCGLASVPALTVGVLNPNPAHRFDPSVLPTVPFGEVKLDRDTGELHVNWLNTEPK